MISGSNEQLQQELEYTLLKLDYHSTSFIFQNMIDNFLNEAEIIFFSQLNCLTYF